MFRSKSTMQEHKKKHIQNNPARFKSQQPSSFRSTIHQNSSSSSSTTHSQTLRSQPTTYKPILHESTSLYKPTSSFVPDLHESTSFYKPTSPIEPNLHESGSFYKPTSCESVLRRFTSSSQPDEIDQDQPDEIEMKLLIEVEIIDAQGSILRTQKMTTKDVYKLNQGEKILVHVNEFCQPIKAAGGLCTRFMTLLLKQPNLCPSEAKDWREVKLRCGIRLLGELRRKFNLPQGDSVDKVIFAIFDEKFRTLKHRFKKSLFELAASKLNEANNIVGQGNSYTEEELLNALDLVATPINFLDHQWELYKSHLRLPLTKKLSLHGKKARADQVHIHTTGALSYARRKDVYKVKNKREPNEVEFFDIAHKTKKGSYVEDSSRELMDQAREAISKKILEIGTEIDLETRSEIERDVMRELMGPRNPGRARGYGAGVTKSQVTKFSFDLRKMRNEALTNENRVLLDKVEAQSKEIESQSKEIESQSTKMKIMEKKFDEFKGELQVFRTAFQERYNVCTSKDMFFTTHDDIGTQHYPGASFEDC